MLEKIIYELKNSFYKFIKPIQEINNKDKTLIFHLILFIFSFGFGNIVYLIYEYLYFKSQKFVEIKKSIEQYTIECNELNYHIEDLKRAYVNFKHINYGEAIYTDNSTFNYKKPNLNKISNLPNVYNCSLQVCKGAQQQPFKYICKYFNIEANENTLELFEKVLNDFSAAEQGKTLLKNKRTSVISSLKTKIPFFIRNFSGDALIKKLGFNEIDFSQLYFPKFSFRYISPGGNSSINCDIILNIPNLEGFICYLSSLIKFKKSVAGQRALMTITLREKIKSRDNYTCKKCLNSIKKEPNLLLEIDHIIPLSKQGMTTEDNLQTLCWKCNRKKGNKIE